MDDIDALLADAVPAQDTMPVCLRGDLLDEYRRVEREHRAATESASDSLAGNPDAQLLADRLAELRGQVQAATVPVVLRAMHPHRWPLLIAEHPPREDVPTDRIVGYNPATYFPALVRASIHSPDMTDDVRWERFLAVLSDATWDDLGDRAWKLNQTRVDVPFWPAASTSPGTSVPA